MQHPRNWGQCCHQAPTHCNSADTRLALAYLPPEMQNEGLKHPGQANPSCKSTKQH